MNYPSVQGFEIDESTNGTDWTVLTNNTNSTQQKYVVTGLTNGVAYWFRVAALTQASGLSLYSNAVTATPIGAAQAPVGVSAVSNAGQVQVSWTTPTNTGGTPIAFEEVQYSTDNGTTWQELVQSTVQPVNSILVKAPVAGNFLVRVAVHTEAGVGAWSSATTYNPNAKQTPVTPASGLTAILSAGTVTLTWTASTTTGAGYIVEWRTNPRGKFNPVQSTTSTSATISQLRAGTSYQFEVIAVLGASQSVASNKITIAMKAAPKTVTGVRATAYRAAALVRWSTPTAAVGSFLITLTSSTGNVLSLKVSGKATSAKVRGLVNGQSYQVRIVATANAMTSAPSRAVTVTPLASLKSL
jgi:titin